MFLSEAEDKGTYLHMLQILLTFKQVLQSPNRVNNDSLLNVHNATACMYQVYLLLMRLDILREMQGTICKVCCLQLDKHRALILFPQLQNTEMRAFIPPLSNKLVILRAVISMAAYEA